ncbi:SGNH/GDSL hydrolase family protein [Streptomyces sp. CB01881]|uniref:SGNH/GDSL hydrolase family protein n=1 Tax=Streptomyces sp. CB01881 TaxID=2078691 RepID=UPI000CDBF036|nr:SGNH/GDSL hydrolase family protein [Streptomyces sp. CB01881]AUY47626.1 GDSL family lipase [Streptomyces sp. CB01881]TYC76098.1 GDSL family lipase [Streptomyces sp. CB01881]
MPFDRPPGPTVLFQGDSITDAGRRRDAPADLGRGYVALAAGHLAAARPGLTVLNRGVAGDRVRDLRARWERDTLAHRPDVLSLLVGVNDTWRRYDADQVTSVAEWEADYRHLLTEARDRTGADLILVEPFLVPVTAEQWTWRQDLDPRIHAVRRLAAEFGAGLLSADGLLNQAARTAGGPELVAADGVHPTPLGHRLLAEAWTALVLARRIPALREARA